MKCGASARIGKSGEFAALPRCGLTGNLPNEGAQPTHFGRSKDHRERGVAGGLVCDELASAYNMRATELLHDLGQSLWLDNITRHRRNDGTLKPYIAEFSVTRLTSNPTIFEHAIRESAAKGENGDELFKVFADHDKMASAIPANGDTQAVLNKFANAGMNVDALAAQLQEQRADSFDKSWQDLLE